MLEIYLWRFYFRESKWEQFGPYTSWPPMPSVNEMLIKRDDLQVFVNVNFLYLYYRADG